MKHLSFICLLLFCISCATIPPNTHNQSIKISTGYGPEDLILDTSTGTPRILVSCDGRRKGEVSAHGDIYSIDPMNNSTMVLPRMGEPDSLEFHPHGIDIQCEEGNNCYLYAISHEDEQNVHKYLIQDKELRYEATFTSPLFVSPNALTALPDGSFYVSNDAGKRGKTGPPLSEMALGLKRSKVVWCDGKKEGYKVQIAAEKLGMANGIGIQNNFVYVATTRENNLYQFNVKNHRLVSKLFIAKIKGQDNIRFHDEKIILAAHLKSLAFIRHLRKSKNLSPSVVYRIDPTTKKTEVIYANKGEQISAASGGIIYDGFLYIGQVFDPFVLKVRIE